MRITGLPRSSDFPNKSFSSSQGKNAVLGPRNELPEALTAPVFAGKSQASSQQLAKAFVQRWEQKLVAHHGLAPHLRPRHYWDVNNRVLPAHAMAEYNPIVHDIPLQAALKGPMLGQLGIAFAHEYQHAADYAALAHVPVAEVEARCAQNTQQAIEQCPINQRLTAEEAEAWKGYLRQLAEKIVQEEELGPLGKTVREEFIDKVLQAHPEL